jgi:hypothetical protein
VSGMKAWRPGKLLKWGFHPFFSQGGADWRCFRHKLLLEERCLIWEIASHVFSPQTRINTNTSWDDGVVASLAPSSIFLAS